MHIIFQLISFQLVLIQVYASFYLVFHKGGENSYFIFQLVFRLPLISTPTLYDEKQILIWYHMFKMKNIYNWYQDFTYFQLVLLIYFFQLVSLITRIFILIIFQLVSWFTYIDIFFNWYHVEKICFIVYLDPFVDD